MTQDSLRDPGLCIDFDISIDIDMHWHLKTVVFSIHQPPQYVLWASLSEKQKKAGPNQAEIPGEDNWLILLPDVFQQANSRRAHDAQELKTVVLLIHQRTRYMD